MPHRDQEIDWLVATLVKAGVWSEAEGKRRRRAFQFQMEMERESDDRYVRTGKRRRKRR